MTTNCLKAKYYKTIRISFTCERFTLWDSIINTEDSLVVLDEKSVYPFDKNLKKYQEQLTSHFCRIHKRFIVNLFRIDIYQPKGGNAIVILDNGDQLPVGRAYKKEFEHKWRNGTP